MLAKIVKWVVALLCGALTACAVITVNVYFPEKAVKEAYKSLDEMLLKQGETKKPAEGEPAQGQPAGEEPTIVPPAPPEEKKPEEVKPQSSLRNTRFDLSFVASAFAADNVADDLAVELSSMPEVLKAYDEMRARLPQMNALLASGAIGLNKQGRLTVRDQAKVNGKAALLNAENENRKTVITGMAKAILKINKQPITDAGIKQVLGQAAATYADIKREEAKPGWWVEQPDGSWGQK